MAKTNQRKTKCCASITEPKFTRHTVPVEPPSNIFGSVSGHLDGSINELFSA
jgi:hypothetical protein